MNKLLTLICLISISACTSEPINQYSNWDTYLGDKHSSQYSSLNKINRQNVKQLKLIWEYNGGEAHPDNRSQIQCNPLVIDGVVYATTATLKLIALDGSTGKQIWSFDPFDEEFTNFGMGVNRGLIWYENEENDILFYSPGKYIIAIDPEDGSIIKSFGENGKIDLQKGLGVNEDFFITANTPGIIYKDKLIISGRMSESTNAAPGHIRAFNVHSGKQEWIFHTIPKPGQYGYETWPEDAHTYIGAVNVWTGFALDEENGIVYCPTGSPAYDFYGGDRHGSNLFGNCLLALDANTGERIWHFQTIHHDMWDKDLPAPPNIITVKKNGKEIPAIAQITKNGLLYVFNRLTGEPLYPIEEISVPKSKLEGEQAWPTQPRPTGYPIFSRFNLSEKDLASRSEEASQYAKAIWESSQHGAGAFEPPSEQGTIIFPGFDGGGEWGGAAYDKEEGNLIVNSNELPWLTTMDKIVPASRGEQVYKVRCQNCHGENFEGNQLFGNIPSLIDLEKRLTLAEVTPIITNGKGIMPAFKSLYAMRGYEKLYAPDGYPIITPPWGQLTSIDMNEAKINWQINLGEHKDLTEEGMSITGTENYGGPVVTAGGLIFIAATMDEKIRAFDKDTGELLWQHDLPASGFATPAIYSIDNKQYIIIACGGGKLDRPSGDSWLAFGL